MQRKFNKSKTPLVDQAQINHEDQILLEKINEGYARLKMDEKEWKEELKEREEIQY